MALYATDVVLILLYDFSQSIRASKYLLFFEMGTFREYMLDHKKMCDISILIYHYASSPSLITMSSELSHYQNT
jgi:hypothetical protein